jgi:extracellular matrix regulatory protein A
MNLKETRPALSFSAGDRISCTKIGWKENRIIGKNEEEKNTRKTYTGGSGMGIKLINIGFGNIVSANRIISIVSPESAPIKRIIQEARDRGMLIDATYGRRTRAVIITDSDHVILSAVQPETVAQRLNTKEDKEDDPDE